VVDSGQQAAGGVLTPEAGMTRQLTGRLSKASQSSSKGRAGRTQSGVCYRLFGGSSEQLLGSADFTPPEIFVKAEPGARWGLGLRSLSVAARGHRQTAVCLRCRTVR